MDPLLDVPFVGAKHSHDHLERQPLRKLLGRDALEGPDRGRGRAPFDELAIAPLGADADALGGGAALAVEEPERATQRSAGLEQADGRTDREGPLAGLVRARDRHAVAMPLGGLSHAITPPIEHHPVAVATVEARAALGAGLPGIDIGQRKEITRFQHMFVAHAANHERPARDPHQRQQAGADHREAEDPAEDDLRGPHRLRGDSLDGPRLDVSRQAEDGEHERDEADEQIGRSQDEAHVEPARVDACGVEKPAGKQQDQRDQICRFFPIWRNLKFQNLLINGAQGRPEILRIQQ